MQVLFVSRKKLSDVGGLSRFAYELSSRFKGQSHTLSPESILNLFRLPFLKIDVIYLCDATLLPFGLLLKTVFRKPLVVTAHGLDLTFPNVFYQLMLKSTLNRTDSIVLDSHPAKKLLSPFPLLNKKISIINPGISVKQFKTIKQIKLPNTNGKTVLLTVGNLVKRKGHAWFIKNVLVKLPQDFLYFIVGEGKEQTEIETLIARYSLNKRVYMLGKLTNKQLAYVYTKTDIYVSPNQKTPNNFESFGIANGEAAAMGLPVIASNVDGISESIIHEKNGILVKPDSKSFITAINLNKHNKKRIVERKKARLYTQKNYAWESTSKKYATVFQEAMNKNQSFLLRTFPS